MKITKLISVGLAAVMGVTMMIPSFAADKDLLIKSVATNTHVPYGYVGITSIDELDTVRDNLDGKYILMNDLDVNSVVDWEPIGDKANPFTGVFNGNGYSISNISLSDSDSTSLGLFGEIKDAVVANLSVKNISIKADNPNQTTYCVGSVAGKVESSKILNCSANGKIDLIAGGTFKVGGIIGEVTDAGNSSIMNCRNEADIKITGEMSDESLGYMVVQYTNVGGIVGVLQNGNTLSRCINEGNIEIYPINSVITGGVCGAAYYNAPITDSANSGNIYVEGVATAGGICGKSHTLTTCYNTGVITLTKESKSKLGGIAGTTQFDMSEADVFPLPKGTVNAEITNCYYPDSYKAAVSNAEDGDASTVKALSNEEFKIESSFTGFDFAEIWNIPMDAPPCLKYKTNEFGSAINISGCNAGYTFELLGSLVYAESNNSDVISVVDTTATVNTSGTSSIDTINADGDFAVLEVLVKVNENIEAPDKSIFEKISDFFVSLIVKIINFFDFAK